MRTTAQVGTVAPYDSDRAVETDLGGLFYLVNLALALELYGDFTQPLGPSLALPLWDFVAVVGGRLLRDPRLDEPVWELLRVLAGRGDEPIGVGFVEPDWWRPPSGAAGAAEVVGDATPSEITDRRTDSNGPILLARWIDRLMPHVRFRLRQALGVADFERMLLEHRARVVVANDRLDVFLALATLPVAIRIAGLDRDPAWVPAAGRSIGFHFD
jgi:hypothetical protein